MLGNLLGEKLALILQRERSSQWTGGKGEGAESHSSKSFYRAGTEGNGARDGEESNRPRKRFSFRPLACTRGLRR